MKNHEGFDFHLLGYGREENQNLDPGIAFSFHISDDNVFILQKHGMGVLVSSFSCLPLSCLTKQAHNDL